MLASINDIDFSDIISQILAHVCQNEDPTPTLLREDLVPIGSGRNNWVFQVNREDLKLLLKVGMHSDDLTAFQKQERILQHLREADFATVPRVLHVGRFSSRGGGLYPFMVQELLEGKRLSGVYDEGKYLLAVAQLLYCLHTGLPQATYANIERDIGEKREWIDILRDHVDKWTGVLREARHYSEETVRNLKHCLVYIINRYEFRIAGVHKTLLHGDIFPHNFLVDQEGALAIVDWDSAMLGDPAFEVTYGHRLLGEHYIEIAKKEDTRFAEESFRHRMKIYQPFILLWVLCVTLKKNRDNQQAMTWVEGSLNYTIGQLLQEPPP